MSTTTIEISGGEHGADPFRIRVNGTAKQHMRREEIKGEATQHGTQKYAFCMIERLTNIVEFFEGGHISKSQYKKVHTHMCGVRGCKCGYKGWLVTVETPLC